MRYNKPNLYAHSTLSTLQIKLNYFWNKGFQNLASTSPLASV